MPFRTSFGSLRLALLAAIGASGATACSSSVHDAGQHQQRTEDPDGSSAGGAGGGYDGAGEAPSACVNPRPLTSKGQGTGPTGGFVQCENGRVHRPKASECWSNLDALDAAVPMPAAPDGSATFECRTNGDCTGAPRGYCAKDPFFGPGAPAYFRCHYACTSDSECGTGKLCLCGDPAGECVAATCKTDADCPSGVLCTGNYDACGPIHSFACAPLSSGAGGTCGRPFLVQGSARLASAAPRRDWGFALTPAVAELPASARRALTEHYTAIGLMEHASIAAFARFSLELLSLGAPPELVALATDAMRDETRHARVCFGLATAYGGANIGPGALALGGVLAHSSFEEQVKTAFLEACVGESLAAMEVAEAAARATDPVIAGVLRRIAEDETRHAALGFQFVKWALEQVDSVESAALAKELRAAAESALHDMDAPTEAARDDEEPLLAHGLLPPRVRHALRKTAMKDAVLPCVQALLASSAAPLAA